MREHLKRLAALPEDWNSYGASPPNLLALERAETILTILDTERFLPFHVGADAENGVCISFRRAQRYADISCFNDGEIIAVKAIDNIRNACTVWEVNYSDEDLRRTLRELREFIEQPNP